MRVLFFLIVFYTCCAILKSMKLLSFVVPCYNSQDYMEHCITTLLAGGEKIEILIVNDGSSDDTAHIADRYQRDYPGIVRAIHQENKGHGGAVNTGIAQATGTFIKIVDSDDWVDASAYRKILQTLLKLERTNAQLDMLISNFVYEKTGVKYKKVMHYRSMLPKNEIFQWSDFRTRFGHYILMHSVIYRTQLLRDCGFSLPEHTFYVDNLYVYLPLPYVKRMYYLDVDFYRYYIGRSDQSVNETIMIRRIDQQIRVNKMMIDAYDLDLLEDRHIRRYMSMDTAIITAITTCLLIRSGTRENYQKKCELWNYMKHNNPHLYAYLRKRPVGFFCTRRRYSVVPILRVTYQIVRRMYGLN